MSENFGQRQDIERFRNAPYLKDRFGTLFQWAEFYEAVADKLLAHASNRAPLIQGIHQIAQRVQGLGACVIFVFTTHPGFFGALARTSIEPLARPSQAHAPAPPDL